MVMCIQKNNWQKSVLYVVWFSSSYSSLSLEKLMTERKNQREKKKGIAEFPFPNLYEKRGKEDWIVVSSFMMKKKNLKWNERKEKKKQTNKDVEFSHDIHWLPHMIFIAAAGSIMLLVVFSFVDICRVYNLQAQARYMISPEVFWYAPLPLWCLNYCFVIYNFFIRLSEHYSLLLMWLQLWFS